jgi:carbon starvation protein
VFIVHPNIQFPNVTPFIHGGGPIIKGKLFPFLFVTIACGAISGFHSLVSSGTTPEDGGQGKRRALHRLWGDAVRIAGRSAGADCGLLDESRRLLCHQLRARGFRQAGDAHGEPGHVLARGGRKLAGRSGGAVSLAVGMAQIFRGCRGWPG